MATYQPSNNFECGTDAKFRNACNLLSTALSTIGLVQTSDTGQINLATVANPVAANTIAGYQVWRFNDSLQATCPVYLRIEYGVGNSTAWWGIRMTGGTGTDGAGNLTGVIGRGLGFTIWGSATNMTQYFSGNSSRFTAMLFPGSSTTAVEIFVERIRAADGSDSTLGFVYGTHPNSSPGGTWTTLLYGGMQVIEYGKAVPAAYIGTWTSMPPGQGQMAATPGTVNTTNTSANNVYLMPVYPIGWTVHPPILSYWCYMNADLPSGVPFSADIYGTSRSVRPFGANVQYTSSQVWYCLQTCSASINDNVRPLMAEW